MTTVVFVPGAWHPPTCFRFVEAILSKSGYSTELVNLPSQNPAQEVIHAGFWPDVAAIRNAIVKAIDKGHKVVVFMHSVAGTYGPDAAYELDWATRQSRGLPGGVTHLIFCAATVYPAGGSNASPGNDQYPQWMILSPDGLTFTVDKPVQTFYQDCPADLAAEAAASLAPTASSIYTCKVEHDTWKTIPSTYIRTNLDQALLPAFQDYFISTTTGFEFKIEQIDTGHSPFLAKPEETAEIIVRAINS